MYSYLFISSSLKVVLLLQTLTFSLFLWIGFERTFFIVWLQIIIICTISIASAVAQISPAFFGATFPSGFVNPFSDLGSPQSSAFPNQGAPRSSTGNSKLKFYWIGVFRYTKNRIWLGRERKWFGRHLAWRLTKSIKGFVRPADTQQIVWDSKASTTCTCVFLSRYGFLRNWASVKRKINYVIWRIVLSQGKTAWTALIVATITNFGLTTFRIFSPNGGVNTATD